MPSWDRYKQSQAEIAASVREEFRKIQILEKVDETIDAINNSALTLQRVSKYLANLNYEEEDYCDVCKRKGMKPDSAAKIQMGISKSIDELFRLLQFARGFADSRTEVVGLKDLMPLLPDELFKQVVACVEAKQTVH